MNEHGLVNKGTKSFFIVHIFMLSIIHARDVQSERSRNVSDQEQSLRSNHEEGEHQ